MKTGRDWREVSASQGAQRFRPPAEAGRRKEGVSPRLRGARPGPHLDSGLPASRTDSINCYGFTTRVWYSVMAPQEMNPAWFPDSTRE